MIFFMSLKRKETQLRFVAIAVSVLAWLGVLVLTACGELPEDRQETVVHETVFGVARHSTSGCALDDDCEQGLHCFQNLCVSGCTDDEACADDGVCNARGRCVVPRHAVEDTSANATNDSDRTARSIDESGDDQLQTNLPATLILDVSPQQIFIPKTGDDVVVTLTVDRPLPKTGLSYTLAYHDRDERTPVRVAYGDTTVEIPIPLANNIPASGEATGVDIVTAAGRVTVYLVNPLPIDGVYGGTSHLTTLGGASMPIEFLVEAQPSAVTDWQRADALFLLVPTSANRLFGLQATSQKDVWVRAPLVWDDTSAAWVATMSADIDGRMIFGEVLYPKVQRSLRVELRPSADAPGVLQGAWTDRWDGISDRISTDGVLQPASFGMSGQIVVSRAGNRPDKETVIVDLSPVPWSPLPAPQLTHCSTEDLIAIPPPSIEDLSGCQMIGHVDAFEGADPQIVSQCALEYADQYQPSASLGAQLVAFLDPAQDNPYDMSFGEFLDACAQQKNGICVTSRQVKCGRELAAYAYRNADVANGDANALAQVYHAFTQEVFVGAKLAAFHSDTAARLEWLQSSEAPLFLAGPLKDYNLQLLRDWQARVLEPLIDSIFGQLDDAGLAFLTRGSSEANVIAMRQNMLLDLGVLWQSAADSLSVYAKRLNLLENDDAKREARAQTLYHQFFRLYIAGNIIAELGKEVGTTAQNPGIGNYLSALERDIAALEQPFNQLILARSNEVVTSQSLDSSSNSRSLISERHEDAMRAIQSARQSVDIVLDEAQFNELNEEKLRTRYEDQILDLRNELIGLCGLPLNCDATDVGFEPQCDVATDVGSCGLHDFVDASGLKKEQETAVSKAGVVLFDLWNAILAVDIVQQKEDQAIAQLALQVQAADDFAQSIEKRQAMRMTVHAEINTIVQDIARLNNEALTSRVQAIAQQQQIRERAYKQQEVAVARWSQIEANGVQSDIKLLNKANKAASNASILRFSGERVARAAAVAATAVPEVSANPFEMIANVIKAVVKTGIKTLGYIASTAMGAVANSKERAADAMEVEMEIGGLQGEQYTTEMKDMEGLGAKRTQVDIANLQGELDALDLQTDAAIDAIRSLVDALDRGLELDEAIDRDMMALRDRRDAILMDQENLGAFSYELSQAELTVTHQNLAYMDIVQRAKVLEVRFKSAQNRWSNIESILGSPDVIFSFANRLALAESRLDYARTALQEWLIALEYYAVRPFVSQRIAILLARNPQQLEAIAHELERLQGACGGVITTDRVVVSLRDNLLGLNMPTLLTEGEEGESDVVATPAERFRALLRRANTPVNKQARLNAKQTIGQRLAAGNVLAANFTLSVNDFANLPQTCNAKVDSIAAQLVGLEDVDIQPVVTIVYDGASELRSCQADIRELVLAVGPEATTFGPVTRFRTGSRAISPVAGLIDFGSEKTWNATLEGTPLAAGYTILIDKELPANKDVEWDRLEDIRLQFAYSYQDVFPDGQCQ